MEPRKALDYCKCDNCSEKNGGKCLKTIYNEKTIRFSKGFFNEVFCFDCQQERKV